MTGEISWFPYNPIQPHERKQIIDLCGGEPVTEVNAVKNFIDVSGKPMVSDFGTEWWMPRIAYLATKAAQTLDISPLEGGITFRHGYLFYAALLTEITPLVKLPCESRVLDNLLSQDDYAFTWTTIERLQEEAASFCDLIDAFRGVLGTTDEQLHRVSLMGAGMIHIIATESLREHIDIIELELQHPELAELKELFEELG